MENDARQIRIGRAREIIRNRQFLNSPEPKQLTVLRTLLDKGLLYEDLRAVLQEVHSPLLVHFLPIERPVTPARTQISKEQASIDCARLLTRALKDLDVEQRQRVMDYLASVGADITSNPKALTNSRELCVFLLEKLMIDEYGNKVPVTAYANNILQKAARALELKEEELRNLEQQRKDEEDRLFVEEQQRAIDERQRMEEQQERLKEQQERLNQQKERMERDQNMRAERLTRQRALAAVDTRSHACTLASNKIFSVVPYSLVVNANTGLRSQDTNQIAGVSLPDDLFYEIAYSGIVDPVLEITTGNGVRAYARQTDQHPRTTTTPKGDPIVFVSPPLAKALQLNPKNQITLAIIKLCTFLPKIAQVELAYYGTELELSRFQVELEEKLSQLITSYSYLSLGMLLSVEIPDEDGNIIVHEARVDALYDSTEDSIFVGLLPIGEVNIAPTIRADVQ